MNIFITGTDTGVGKTIISAWLCLHLGYDYFKPIQTGNTGITDSYSVELIFGCKVYKEVYSYKAATSPHIAAAAENEVIDIAKIKLPASKNLIIEGAGGVMVPLNEQAMMIDLIKQFGTAVIIVINPKLGAINHSLLTIQALRSKGIDILGVIFNGDIYPGSHDIAKFGQVEILAELPKLNELTKEALLNIPILVKLKELVRPSETL